MNETLDDILDYENGKNVAYSGNVTNGYYHHVGFIFEPGIGAKQRAFLLKITLPNGEKKILESGLKISEQLILIGILY